MNVKNRITLLFFILSLMFAFLSMPFGAALSQGKMERAATARLADDENAILKLKGFNNKVYDMNGSYTKFGTITNNTNQTITLIVTIKPDYNIQNLLTRFSMKIGTIVTEFRFSQSSQKQVSITLTPGQVVDVQTSISQNFFSTLLTEFYFEASNLAGTYTMQLGDTPQTPRRIYCY